MRGQILGVDRDSAEGQIAGDDGVRYRFRRSDWADQASPAIGLPVDFVVEGDRATKVYRVPGVAPAVAPEPAAKRTDRNRFVAAILAFFVGVFGVHRFYLGRTGSGVVMLVLTITVIGLVVTGLWAFIDMIRYLVMSDAEFERRSS